MLFNRLVTVFSLCIITSGFISAATGYKEINSVEEYNKIIKSEKPMAIMYSSPTCGPCKAMKPFFGKIAQKFSNVTCYVVNAGSSSFTKILDKLNVTGFPTVIMRNNKQEIKRERGGMSNKELTRSIQDFVTEIAPSKAKTQQKCQHTKVAQKTTTNK